jgi:hypothetical protein
MAKSPRSRAKAPAIPPTSAGSLIAALEFCNVAQRDIGQPHQSHVRLSGGWAVAYDGILTAATRIVEDLTCCPHTQRLIDTLKRCKGGMTIAATEHKLKIASGGLLAYVPCIAGDLMADSQPDPVIATIDDRIKQGFDKVMRLASDNAQHVVTSSILLRAGSMLATDRHVMLEFWHGNDLPPDLVIPKTFAAAVAKTIKPLARLGYSPTSVTFWFEDQSWIKTQLYSDPWPKIEIFDGNEYQFSAIPAEFWEGLAAVAPHCDDSRIHFLKDALRSHKENEVGAGYLVPGLAEDWCFNPKHLLQMQGLMTHYDLGFDNGIAYFLGENIRGACTSVKD